MGKHVLSFIIAGVCIAVFLLSNIVAAQTNEYYIYSSKVDESFSINDFQYSIENNWIYFDLNLSNNRNSDRIIKVDFYSDDSLRTRQVVLGAESNSDYKISFPIDKASTYSLKLDDGDTNFDINLNVIIDDGSSSESVSISSITGNVVGNESAGNYSLSWVYGFIITFIAIFAFYRVKKRRDRIRSISTIRDGRFIELKSDF